eukprot:6241892-Prymnesium_polylepis.2
MKDGRNAKGFALPPLHRAEWWWAAFGTCALVACHAQVMTGESWSEAVARPVLFGSSSAFAGFYYGSFIIVMQIVLVNVRSNAIRLHPLSARVPMAPFSANDCTV